MRDPHEILGVPWNADPRHIRAAYRKRAAQLHPDRNSEPDAADRLKEVVEAYRFLSDPGRFVDEVDRYTPEPSMANSAAATMDTAEFRRHQTFRYHFEKLISPRSSWFVPPRRLRCFMACALGLIYAAMLVSTAYANLAHGQSLAPIAMLVTLLAAAVAMVLIPDYFADLGAWSSRRGFFVMPDWLVEGHGWVILGTLSLFFLPALRAIF